MKLNIKNEIKKQDMILFLCIWIFTIIMNNAFLQRHYSSDTMCLLYHGYFEYPTNYFLLDGRIFSTLICYLGGVLKLSVDTYQFISNFIGIILLSLSIIILFKFTVNYLKIENKWIKFLVLLSLYTIIINHMSIEYLLYPESCIMCASMLLCVLAAKIYLNGKKGSVIKSFLYLLLGTLCYQGLISIFPTIVITLSLLKNINFNKIETFKFYTKEVFKVGIMFVTAMATSAILIVVFNTILQNTSNRIEKLTNMFSLIKDIPILSFRILLVQAEKIPKYLSVIVMCITLLIIRYNEKLDVVLKYTLSFITAYVFSVIPLIAYGYVTSRVLMSVGAVMGISMLFVTLLLNDKKNNISIKNIKTVIISIGVTIYFVFNVTNNYIAGYEHLKAFSIDEKIGKRISEIVTKYENSTENEVTKFSYYYDLNPQRYNNGIKRLESLTERKFAMRWCITESVSYYCNKKLENVRFSPKVYYDNFYKKDYTEFSEEQLVFVNDTLYMYVY